MALKINSLTPAQKKLKRLQEIACGGFYFHWISQINVQRFFYLLKTLSPLQIYENRFGWNAPVSSETFYRNNFMVVNIYNLFFCLGNF